MSPWLFNLFMDTIVRDAREKSVGGVKMEETTMQLLLFSVNLMVMMEKDEDLERSPRMLDELKNKRRIQINCKKKKVLRKVGFSDSSV